MKEGAEDSKGEIEGVPEESAREAFKLAAAKLPVRTAFVRRTLL